jgi:hypothetical protein
VIRALVLALAAIAVAVGCGTIPRVPLTDDFPACSGDYDDMTEAWTRTETLRGEYQEMIKVSATFKSTQWRAAYVGRHATNKGLDAAAASALCAAEKAKYDAGHDVELIVTTWDRKENNLHRKDKATWKVALINDAGQMVEPTKVDKDRRPIHEIRSEFPDHDYFSEAYVAYFPREPAVTGPSAKQIRLRVYGSRGAVELVWQAP